MKQLIIIYSIIIVAFSGCEKPNKDKIPDGVYTGTFQRQLAFGGGDTLILNGRNLGFIRDYRGASGDTNLDICNLTKSQ